MTDLRRSVLRTLIAPLFLAAVPLSGAAQEIAWPEGSTMALASTPALGHLQIATGPYAEGTVPGHTVDGMLTEQVWHIPGASGSPAALFSLLRAQLEDQGFEILFSCSDRHCGGFDFRHALEIAEGPVMHVDLGNFRYLSARQPRDEGGAVHLALVLSQGGRQGYAHVSIMAPPDSLPTTMTSSAPASQPVGLADGTLIGRLTAQGRAVLVDLAFATGASALEGEDHGSLAALGTFLIDNPDARVLLVGHTDAEGALDGNIALSRARAEAVRQRLIERYGVAPEQLRAEGAGYLAPVASNATADGREANRRVEAILLGPA
jgi:OOP family OmpA-OmpF porin